MSLHRASGAWRRGCVSKRVAAAHPSEVSLFPTVVTDARSDLGRTVNEVKGTRSRPRVRSLDFDFQW